MRSRALRFPYRLAALIAVCTLAVMYVAILKLPENFKTFGELPASVEVARTTQPRDAAQPVTDAVVYGSTQGMSYTIFDRFPLAFEVVSLLIFAAILGAVLLARAGAPHAADKRPRGATMLDPQPVLLLAAACSASGSMACCAAPIWF